jgi:hypothetical protein
LFIADITLLFCLPFADDYRTNDRIRALWRQRLKKFEEKCSLVSFLGENMGESVQDKRVIDLDAKLKQFAALYR